MRLFPTALGKAVCFAAVLLAASWAAAQAPDPQTTPAVSPNPTPARAETPASERPRLGARLTWQKGPRYVIGYWVPEMEGRPMLHALTDLTAEGRIGGRLEIDVAGFATSGKAGPIGDDAEVRRARLLTSGHLRFLTSTYYKFEFGLEGQRFYLNDFLLRWEPRRFVDVAQVGYFKAPLGLEELGTRVFMENSLPVAAFAPSFKSGGQLRWIFDKAPVTATIGMFSASQLLDTADASSSDLRAQTRLTWTPQLERTDDGGLNAIHLGVAPGWVFAGGGDVRYRSRPESHIAPYLADTGKISANDAFLFGLEAAWVRGPWSLQGEAIRSTVLVLKDKRDLNFNGAYLQGTWSLTGESRNYDARTALFNRLEPRQPMTMSGGWGAVELALRVSWLDLDDRFVSGGIMRDAGAGVNWYLNRYVALAFNYVYSDVNGGQHDGTASIFESRLTLTL